jgi:hypothetical protein
VRLRTRALRQCHHQTSLTARTIFEATKLPLTTWFLAMSLLSQQRNGIMLYASAAQARTGALVANAPEGRRSMSRSLLNSLWNCSQVPWPA